MPGDLVGPYWSPEAAAALEKASQSVQRVLSEMTEGVQSGEDSGLKTIWEEYCVQIQGEHFGFFGLYKEIVYSLAEGAAESLSAAEQSAVWLDTSDGMRWGREGKNEQPPVDLDTVAEHVMQRVNSLATDWRSAAIEDFLANRYRE